MSWQFWGITFHAYGLILGLALVVALWLIEKRAQQAGQFPQAWSKIMVITILGGVVGARLWHLATDWNLYAADWQQVWFVWQGGLSIVGAVVGGFVSLLGACLVWQVQAKFSYFLDLAVFGLPLGQAIGRVANWLNQELYGAPTNVPWAIYIEPQHRLSGLKQAEYYHPLFMYELLGTASFGLGLWWFDARLSKQGKSWLGTGGYFWLYVAYYCLLRFMLDFWRIDKAVVSGWVLGVNQIWLLGFGLLASLMLYRSYSLPHNKV
jgi:phosphatidylglycerol---prolipoprotein diacylglyceryl transferase